MGGTKKIDTRKIKNKDFLTWMRSESSYTRDNLVSSEWHERLERIPMFVPTYAKGRPEMGYIMSMEYGRMWHKEKDEWFAEIYKDSPKDREMRNRRKKLRMEFLEAKRQAEIKIKERKERLAKEAEAKAKAEAEAQEKAKRIKAKLEKCAVKKKEKKKKQPEKQETQTDNKDQGTCPKGWTQVELTLQCECAANKGQENQEKKETDQEKKVEENELETKKEEKTVENVPCTPECIRDQIAEEVQKAQADDFRKECDRNQEEPPSL